MTNKLTDAEITEKIPFATFDLDSAESWGTLKIMQRESEPKNLPRCFAATRGQ
jgi:hypothetical protein